MCSASQPVTWGFLVSPLFGLVALFVAIRRDPDSLGSSVLRNVHAGLLALYALLALGLALSGELGDLVKPFVLFLVLAVVVELALLPVLFFSSPARRGFLYQFFMAVLLLPSAIIEWRGARMEAWGNGLGVSGWIFLTAASVFGLVETRRARTSAD